MHEHVYAFRNTWAAQCRAMVPNRYEYRGKSPLAASSELVCNGEFDRLKLSGQLPNRFPSRGGTDPLKRLCFACLYDYAKTMELNRNSEENQRRNDVQKLRNIACEIIDTKGEERGNVCNKGWQWNHTPELVSTQLEDFKAFEVSVFSGIAPEINLILHQVQDLELSATGYDQRNWTIDGVKAYIKDLQTEKSTNLIRNNSLRKLLLLDPGWCSLSHQLPIEELPSNASILRLPFSVCSADEQSWGSSVLIYSSQKSLSFSMQKGYSEDNPSIASCSSGGIYGQ
ncbi:hypothetical protein SADUNF_Sadunf04G0040100 [Salix dunnii]|uniref:Uncharacterized protein n=1 Tax=Salix dunnii TaxID=1413687 RepID=A0A835MYM3_9ROSI|nr:hypothetical protein SADUNF_Sadunf04G0040100 [Salix dunnii]